MCIAIRRSRLLLANFAYRTDGDNTGVFAIWLTGHPHFLLPRFKLFWCCNHIHEVVITGHNDAAGPPVLQSRA